MFRKTAPLVLLALAACGGSSQSDETEQPFTSDVATLLTFEFDATLVTASPALPKGQIRAQLLYTVGQLNGVASVARLDKVQLSNIVTTALGAGLSRIAYHARLPVAWGSKTNLPTSFPLSLPLHVDAGGQNAFFSAYSASCGQPEGHELLLSNFWFYYRPAMGGCAVASADASAPRTSVSVHPLNTVSKYPEYHRVWEDGSLDVLAVFGKYEKGATSDYDAGISALNAFVAAVRTELPGATITPASLTGAPGAANPDVVIQAQLPNGRTVSVAALLVDEVKTAPPSFDKRYAELSAGADLIVYNGHAGLGSNVASLALKGAFFPGKYQIVFFDGCDTFAYADDTLATRRAALNTDDPTGTKYMDVVTNAMPAFFANMSDASMALIRALLNPEVPKSYPAIFHEVSADHVVVAMGEEDNVFRPGTPLTPRFSKLHENGFVGYGESVVYTTDLLPAGSYSFQLTADWAFPSGDGDLRVRAGSAPLPGPTYKCKSYVGNTNEKCTLKLTAPSKVFLSVTGDKQGAQSHFDLRGFGG